MLWSQLSNHISLIRVSILVRILGNLISQGQGRGHVLRRMGRVSWRLGPSRPSDSSILCPLQCPIWVWPRRQWLHQTSFPSELFQHRWRLPQPRTTQSALQWNRILWSSSFFSYPTRNSFVDNRKTNPHHLFLVTLGPAFTRACTQSLCVFEISTGGTEICFPLSLLFVLHPVLSSHARVSDSLL